MKIPIIVVNGFYLMNTMEENSSEEFYLIWEGIFLWRYFKFVESNNFNGLVYIDAK